MKNGLTISGTILLTLVAAYVGIEGTNQFKDNQKIHAIQLSMKAPAKPAVPVQAVATAPGHDALKQLVTSFLDRINKVIPGSPIDVPKELMSASFYADFQRKQVPDMEKSKALSDKTGIVSQDAAINVTSITWKDPEHRVGQIAATQTIEFQMKGKPVYTITYDNQFEVTQGAAGGYLISMWTYKRTGIQKLRN